MSTQKKIAFEDIREGDTVRMVDIRDLKVAEVYSGEIRGKDGFGSILSEAPFSGTQRKFQLLDRPMEPLPNDLGSAITVKRSGSLAVWFLGMMEHAPICMWHNAVTGSMKGEMAMEAYVREYGGFEQVA